MSLWKIAWRSIQQRGLASSLTGISMALGVMLVVAVLVIHGAINQSFLNNEGLGYNLVIGAKGGRLDLVLNSVYYLARPIENIPYAYYQEFTEGKFAPSVQTAIPLCLGDTYEEFRVIGTTPDFFDKLDYGGNQYEFSAGRNFKADEVFGAVIGATVARETGLKEGDAFQPSHSGGPEAHVHEEQFTVKGVLAPTGTPNDRGLFINMEGFYLIPEHKSEDDLPVAAQTNQGDVHDHDEPGHHDEHADGHTHADGEPGHDHEAGHKHADDEPGHDHEAGHKHADGEHEHADGDNDHDHAEGEDHEGEPVDDEDDNQETGAKHAGRPDGDSSEGGGASQENAATKDADHEHEEDSNHDGEESAEPADDEHADGDRADGNHEHEDEGGEHADEHAKEHADHEHAAAGDANKHTHAHDEEHAHEHGHEHDDEHGHGHDHGHQPVPLEQREVTAVLVLTASIGGAPPELLAPGIMKQVNEGTVAQAAQPIREMSTLFTTFVDPLRIVLLSLTVLIVIVAGIGILVSIYNSMSERRHEIAVMRALGAGRRTVMLIVLAESILLSLAGGLAGWAVGHGLVGLVSPWIAEQTGVAIGAAQFVGYELVIIPGLIVLATVVGYLPAMAAYRTDVAKALSANP